MPTKEKRMKLFKYLLIFLSLSAGAAQLTMRDDIAIAELKTNIDVDKCISNFKSDWCLIKNEKQLEIIAPIKREMETIIDIKDECVVRAVNNGKAVIVHVNKNIYDDLQLEEAKACLYKYRNKIERHDLSFIFFTKK
jgi:prefoldin subunit 5